MRQEVGKHYSLVHSFSSSSSSSFSHTFAAAALERFELLDSSTEDPLLSLRVRFVPVFSLIPMVFDVFDDNSF